jgi:ABC-type dipeptide/oligopeptide/nickel transport system permease component
MEVLRTDYIKFARAAGLPNRAINFGHALKNTLVPVITIAGSSWAPSSPSPS